jgi:hypothetical protein
MTPLYTITRYPLGWTISGADSDRRGIPCDALSESMPLFPKNAVMCPGIAHHYWAIIAIATPGNVKKWTAEIEASIADLDEHSRWWRGTDVGTSAATIFATLTRFSDLRDEALEFIRDGSTPSDADDFGRCKRLVERIPEFALKLNEVAEKYPDWKPIIDKWDELCAMKPDQVRELLHDLCKTKP